MSSCRGTGRRWDKQPTVKPRKLRYQWRRYLRSNAKHFYDPYQVIDMREEHRREQARDALNTDPETKDPIGDYNRARDAQIPLGKTLMIAGVNHDYFVKEVEV